MGKTAPMANSEKPKPRLLDRVLPHVWFIKLRSMRRKPQSLKAPDSEPVIADSAPFLPKVVENCYKHGVVTSEMCVFSPLKAPQPSTAADQAFSSPRPEESLFTAFPESTTAGRKSFMHPDETNKRAPVSSIATNTTSMCSVFSRCNYRSAISSLRNLCKLVGDESLADEGGSPVSFRKTCTPTMRAWFLAGCGRVPRHRIRDGSMDLEKEPGLIELDVNTGIECIEEMAEASWRKESESWSEDHPTSWSVDLRDGGVVKWLADAKLSSTPKPTIGAPKNLLEAEEQWEELHAENPNQAPPWSSLSSFGSGDSTFLNPAEHGTKSGKKPWVFSDSEPAALYSGESDKGNTSDSQSLLRAKVLAAEQLGEGSKSFREQRMLERQNEEETKKLLASLDRALDQYNLKKLIEEEEGSDHGYDSRFGSPKLALHNSPVFESFLESSAKAWGIDFPTLKFDESGSISDKSKELHCITVHSATEQERERGREATRSVRLNFSPAKTRKSKRVVEKEAPKKRSPSRNPFPKGTREERTNHPQREESILELRGEFSNTRKKFNETRRRSKQRRSKLVASVPEASPHPLLGKQHGVVKESVAVVVESSYDPYNDFRESMIEMIVDQDIQETSDLEELLQCYLALNESEYHTVIVDVFTDVWHELFERKA